MTKEIERKYVVRNHSWREGAEGTMVRQGFLSTDKHRVVRVRVAGGQAYLTVKGITEGVSRTEFEYEIPVIDAETMLDELCHKPLIEKTRYKIELNDLVWEIDEFYGVNEGLVIAEVELNNESQHIEPPDWLGEEVSHDPRYYNANLISNPFTQW